MRESVMANVVKLVQQEEVTSVEIAKAFEKQHSNVRKDIRGVCDRLDIGLDSLHAWYNSDKTKGLSCYKLRKRLAQNVILGYLLTEDRSIVLDAIKQDAVLESAKLVESDIIEVVKQKITKVLEEL